MSTSVEKVSREIIDTSEYEATLASMESKIEAAEQRVTALKEKRSKFKSDTVQNSITARLDKGETLGSPFIDECFRIIGFKPDDLHALRAFEELVSVPGRYMLVSMPFQETASGIRYIYPSPSSEYETHFQIAFGITNGKPPRLTTNEDGERKLILPFDRGIGVDTSDTDPLHLWHDLDHPATKLLDLKVISGNGAALAIQTIAALANSVEETIQYANNCPLIFSGSDGGEVLATAEKVLARWDPIVKHLLNQLALYALEQVISFSKKPEGEPAQEPVEEPGGVPS